MKFKPFTQNVIFLDGEFTSLDPYEGELLSVGMVKLDGEEFYVELANDGPVSDWVEENVLPFLTGPKVTRQEAARQIEAFVGKTQPYMLAYVNQFDTVFLHKLLGLDRFNALFQKVPIDLSSILFTLGVAPQWGGDKDKFFKQLGIEQTQYRAHHALDDARLLRDVYLRLAETQ